MLSNLVALRQDPRWVASIAAFLFVLIDDVPSQRYATFRDPGAAVMLSVIFGDCLALAVRRRWDRTGVCFLVIASVFKFFLQGLFYVQNAAIIDSAFLLFAHFLIAAAMSRGARPVGAAIQGFAGVFAVAIGLMILRQAEIYAERNQSFEILFFTYAAARVLIPLLFWTTLLALAPILQVRLHPPYGSSTQHH